MPKITVHGGPSNRHEPASVPVAAPDKAEEATSETTPDGGEQPSVGISSSTSPQPTGKKSEPFVMLGLSPVLMTESPFSQPQMELDGSAVSTATSGPVTAGESSESLSE